MGSDLEEQSDEQIAQTVLLHPQAFGVLMQRYEAKLLRYLRRLGISSEEDAEDVLQNVFLNAYRHLRGFDPSLSFSSWVYRIAHNEAMSFFRKRRVRPQGHYVMNGDEVLERIKDDADTSYLAEVKMDAEQLERAMSRLPQKYRDVVLLRYFEERDYKEISDILKIPPGSVATHLHRAKKLLRKEFETLYDRS